MFSTCDFLIKGHTWCGDLYKREDIEAGLNMSLEKIRYACILTGILLKGKDRIILNRAYGGPNTYIATLF